MSITQPKLSIILPVRNESARLKIFLKMLKASLSMDHEVLVIFDDSRDNSLVVVNSLLPKYPALRLIQNQYNSGVSGALRTGINAARGVYSLVLAADDPGPLCEIEKMTVLMDEGYDLINASRYRRGGYYIGGHWLSRRLSWLANKIFYRVVSTELTDATFGIKMFRTELMRELFLEAGAGWSIAFEMSIKARLSFWRMKEVAVTSLNRLRGGASSFKPWSWIREYSKWFGWALKQYYDCGQLRFQNRAGE